MTDKQQQDDLPPSALHPDRGRWIDRNKKNGCLSASSFGAALGLKGKVFHFVDYMRNYADDPNLAFKGNIATFHGQRTEDISKKVYEILCGGTQVDDGGFFISKDDPLHLASSPDGLVSYYDDNTNNEDDADEENTAAAAAASSASATDADASSSSVEKEQQQKKIKKKFKNNKEKIPKRLLEIKSPTNAIYDGSSGDQTCHGIPKVYMCQMQGQIFFTGAEECDFFVFVAKYPPAVALWRVKRSQEFYEWMRPKLLQVCKWIVAPKQQQQPDQKNNTQDDDFSVAGTSSSSASPLFSNINNINKINNDTEELLPKNFEFETFDWNKIEVIPIIPPMNLKTCEPLIDMKRYGFFLKREFVVIEQKSDDNNTNSDNSNKNEQQQNILPTTTILPSGEEIKSITVPKISPIIEVPEEAFDPLLQLLACGNLREGDWVLWRSAPSASVSPGRNDDDGDNSNMSNVSNNKISLSPHKQQQKPLQQLTPTACSCCVCGCDSNSMYYSHSNTSSTTTTATAEYSEEKENETNTRCDFEFSNTNNKLKADTQIFHEEEGEGSQHQDNNSIHNNTTTNHNSSSELPRIVQVKEFHTDSKLIEGKIHSIFNSSSFSSSSTTATTTFQHQQQHSIITMMNLLSSEEDVHCDICGTDEHDVNVLLSQCSISQSSNTTNTNINNSSSRSISLSQNHNSSNNNFSPKKEEQQQQQDHEEEIKLSSSSSYSSQKEVETETVFLNSLVDDITVIRRRGRPVRDEVQYWTKTPHDNKRKKTNNNDDKKESDENDDDDKEKDSSENEKDLSSSSSARNKKNKATASTRSKRFFTPRSIYLIQKLWTQPFSVLLKSSYCSTQQCLAHAIQSLHETIGGNLLLVPPRCGAAVWHLASVFSSSGSGSKEEEKQSSSCSSSFSSFSSKNKQKQKQQEDCWIQLGDSFQLGSLCHKMFLKAVRAAGSIKSYALSNEICSIMTMTAFRTILKSGSAGRRRASPLQPPPTMRFMQKVFDSQMFEDDEETAENCAPVAQNTFLYNNNNINSQNINFNTNTNNSNNYNNSGVDSQQLFKQQHHQQQQQQPVYDVWKTMLWIIVAEEEGSGDFPDIYEVAVAAGSKNEIPPWVWFVNQT